MFSGCTKPADSKETELDQEASPSPSKNTEVVLVPSPEWKYIPTAISGGMGISEVLGAICYDR